MKEAAYSVPYELPYYTVAPFFAVGLDRSADVNLIAKDGTTALGWAAFNGHTAVVQALLEAGADVTPKDTDGETAMMAAEREGHTEIVELLKKAGAKE